MAKLPMGGCVTPVTITRDVWDPLGLYLNQKDLKSGMKWLRYGQFTSGRLRDSVSIIRDVWDPLGLHLNQKDLKSG